MFITLVLCVTATTALFTINLRSIIFQGFTLKDLTEREINYLATAILGVIYLIIIISKAGRLFKETLLGYVLGTVLVWLSKEYREANKRND